MSESQALCCEAVEVGSGVSLITSAREVISAEGVYDDDEHIGSQRRAPAAREGERKAPEESAYS
jgi:hypothetical protein